MFGYGSFDHVVAVLDQHFIHQDYAAGERFTAADVYVGSAIMWGTQFGTLPQRESFSRYTDHLSGREALQRAGKLDDEAQAQLQAAQPQPA